MKRYALYIITTLLFVSYGSLHAETSETVDAVIANYFEALKNGNIDTIRNYIAGNFYKKKKTLLENNKDYPEFLREFYQGAEVQIRNSTQVDDKAVAEVWVYSPDRSISVTKIRLEKDSSNTWKIVEEIND